MCDLLQVVTYLQSKMYILWTHQIQIYIVQGSAAVVVVIVWWCWGCMCAGASHKPVYCSVTELHSQP